MQAGGRRFDPDHLHQYLKLRAGSSVGLERALDKREVGSSSLPRPTINNFFYLLKQEAVVVNCKYVKPTKKIS